MPSTYVFGDSLLCNPESLFSAAASSADWKILSILIILALDILDERSLGVSSWATGTSSIWVPKSLIVDSVLDNSRPKKRTQLLILIYSLLPVSCDKCRTEKEGLGCLQDPSEGWGLCHPGIWTILVTTGSALPVLRHFLRFLHASNSLCSLKKKSRSFSAEPVCGLSVESWNSWSKYEKTWNFRKQMWEFWVLFFFFF